MRSRKADLSLSVNSIVILIFAVTILGLGLAFIRNQFMKMDAFDFKNIPDPSAATNANPVTMYGTSPNSAMGNSGATAGIRVDVYNGGVNDLISVKPEVTCDDSRITYKAPQNDIRAGNHNVYNVVIVIPRDVTPTDYVCTAKVANVGSVDFTLAVKK